MIKNKIKFEKTKKELKMIFKDMNLKYTDREICLYVKGFLNGSNLEEIEKNLLYDYFKTYSRINSVFTFEEIQYT